MEQQYTPVTGGIGLLHSVKDGKHHYEVDTVFNDNMNRDKAFMRQGDLLLKINELDMEDLSPEMFGKVMTKGNIMLTVHRASTEEVKTDAVNPSEKTGGFRPVFKENTVLTFSMNTDQDPKLQVEEDFQEKGELEINLVVKMMATCVEQVNSRGCAHGQTCDKCASTDCFQDIVMISENVEVSSGFRKDKEEQDNVVISSLCKTYLSDNKRNEAILKKTKQNITIYYYESDQVDENQKGVPVVLNFTKTNKYLQCSRTESGINISVMTCKKEDLDYISKNNEELLSFVFYMRADQSASHIFESASCEGWCVNAKSSTSVDATDQTQIDSLYFFISSYKPFSAREMEY